MNDLTDTIHCKTIQEPFNVLYAQIVDTLLELSVMEDYMKNKEGSERECYESLVKNIIKQNIIKLLVWGEDKEYVDENDTEFTTIFDNCLTCEDMLNDYQMTYVRAEWISEDDDKAQTVDIENITYDAKTGDVYCQGWSVNENGERNEEHILPDMYLNGFSLNDHKKLLYNMLMPLCEFYQPFHDVFGEWEDGDGNDKDATWFQWLLD